MRLIALVLSVTFLASCAWLQSPPADLPPR